LIYSMGEKNLKKWNPPFISSHLPFQAKQQKIKKNILFARFFVAPYVQLKRRFNNVQNEYEYEYEK